MPQEAHIQKILNLATKDLPVTIEHEIFWPKRILLKVTHEDGRSVLVSNERIALFRLERCVPTMSNLFQGVIDVRWPSYR